MRLIDADEFIGELKSLYKQAGWDQREIHFSLADIICNIEMMPTVEPKVIYGREKWVFGEHGWEMKEE